MRRHPVAVLDACVLVPMPPADTLLRLAEPPAPYAPRWTNEILGEVTRTLVGRFGKAPDKARYREMKNHPKDRHVLAAAVACRADYLVTFNLKDFAVPDEDRRTVIVTGPSGFLKRLAQPDRPVIEQRLRDQAAAIGIGIDALFDRLDSSVPAFVSFMRNRDLEP